MSRQWVNLSGPGSRSFTCGFCGHVVSSNQGWFTNNQPQEFVFVCPNCTRPVYFGDVGQVPGVAPGNDVGHLPEVTAKLYKEARMCVAAGAPTSSVLASRKLLMHIAVEQGAPTGASFMAYVEYLANSGYVPPNGKGWVDHIRKNGNEASHEIVLMTTEDVAGLGSGLPFAC